MRLTTALLMLTVLIAVSVTATAETTVIPKYTVIPVAIENGLNSAVSRPGDEFHARTCMEECGGFPQETRFLGEVICTTPKSGKYPGQIQVAFVQATLPDGKSVAIQGGPISLDVNQVVRDPKTGLPTALGGLLVLNYRFIAYDKPYTTLVGTIEGDELTGGLICPSPGYVCRAKIGRLKAVREADVAPGTPFGIVLTEDAVIGKRVAKAPTPYPPEGAGPKPRVLRLTFDKLRPFISAEGVVMVPLRPILLQVGTPFEYLNDQKTVVINADDCCIQHRANSKVLHVNGRTETMNVPSHIINGRIYVSVEAIDLLTGKKATWDASNGVLTIQ